MIFQKKYLIGQELVRRGKISQDDLDFALIEHERKGEKLGQILIKCGFISEDDLLEVLADQLGVCIQRIAALDVPKEVLNRVSAKTVRQLKVIPVAQDGTKVVVCVSFPLLAKDLEKLREEVKGEVTMVIDSDRNVLAAIKKYYGLTDPDDVALLDDLPKV